MDTNPIAPPQPRVAAPQRRRHRRWVVPALILLALVAAAVFLVRRHNATRPATAQKHSQPATDAAIQSVTTAPATRADIPITLAALGTVTPLVTVTIRSQVSGYLTQIAFAEGQEVRRGDFIAQIDPRPFQAVLEQYQGNLIRDQALLRNAQLDLKRYQGLSRLDSISRQNVDTQASTVAQYQGAVKTDQGLIDAQQLNLAYAHITAPSDGRLGLRQVDSGNYVTPADTAGIAVLTQLRPMSVVFTLPQTELAPVLARLKQTALPVTALGPDNATVLARGTVTIIDNQIDASTGTVKLRALFANDDESLFPNQFVNTTLLVDTLHDVVTVPDEAVQRGTPGTYVYLVGPDDTVSLHPITTGPSAGGRTAVAHGLNPGDVVVIDGTSRLRAGTKVRIISQAAKAQADQAADTAPPTQARHAHKGTRGP